MSEKTMIKEIIERRRQWGETRLYDFEWLIEQAEKLEGLEKELEKMTEDRNMYRSNSLDWQGEEEEE